MKTQKISRPDNSLQKFYSSRRGAGFTTLEFMGGSNYDRPFFFVALSPNSAKDICRTHGASSKAIITSEQSLTKDSIRASYPALVDHAVIERKLREYEEYIDHLESIIYDKANETLDVIHGKFTMGIDPAIAIKGDLIVFAKCISCGITLAGKDSILSHKCVYDPMLQKCYSCQKELTTEEVIWKGRAVGATFGGKLCSECRVNKRI